ncbi:hypothetical protein [Nostoc sp. DedSLP04]|uniref:hypothetical protein n=1 Tax=Nostoc sp. DedSLP04 TaxID=3075401 RepID=UPI002AD1FB6B|nr:hypothetical protein [Nostoc sp. DedSLP04]MDZ8034021.1 hypothetical protein [Nostoc sp. DedSLP04]
MYSNLKLLIFSAPGAPPCGKPFGFGGDARRLANASLSQSTGTAKTATPSPQSVYCVRQIIPHLCNANKDLERDGVTAQRSRSHLTQPVSLAPRRYLYKWSGINGQKSLGATEGIHLVG